MRRFKDGSQVSVSYYAGTLQVVYYIPKATSYVLKHLRGTYCLMNSSGQTIYVRPVDMVQINHAK